MHQLNNIRELISAASGSFAGILLIWSLQICIALGATWVATKIDPSHSAANRYKVWMIAFVACVALLPLSLFFRSLPAPVGPAAAAPTASLSPIAGAPLTPVIPHTPVILVGLRIMVPVLWIAGVLLSFLRLTRSLRKSSKIKASAEWVSASQLGLTEAEASGYFSETPIMLSAEVGSPGIAGVFRPVILLPADITSWTTPAERAAMLRHELAHIERRDPLTGLLVAVIRTGLFFHPLVHLAANRIGLERELACDERALAGVEANVYAESIMKAARRSIIVDAVHSALLFASKKTLERRLREILSPDDERRSSQQWRFIAAPVAMILVVVWLVMPRASALSNVSAYSGPGSTPGGADNGATTAAAHMIRHELGLIDKGRQDVPSVDSNSIWVDAVKRGTMRLEIAGMGRIGSRAPGHSTVRLIIPQWGRALLRAGQGATVEIKAEAPAPQSQRSTLTGMVVSIDLRSDGLEDVDVNLEGNIPAWAGPGANVEGVIDLGQQLDDVLSVGRPVFGQPGTTIGLYKLNPDGKGAVRTQAQLGAASWNRIQILSGLEEGDRVIISDTLSFDNAPEISIK
jgi:beta-lactamase regulating signal transducer with metallopeptidase domain